MPGGAPCPSWALRLFLLKISMGGTYWPPAPTQNPPVVVTPLSPLVIDPTCFFPFFVSTFGGVCTVDSALITVKMLVADNLYLSMRLSKKARKSTTIDLLRPLAHATDDGSG